MSFLFSNFEGLSLFGIYIALLEIFFNYDMINDFNSPSVSCWCFEVHLFQKVNVAFCSILRGRVSRQKHENTEFIIVQIYTRCVKRIEKG